MINGELFFRFQYTVYPKIRWVSEQFAPKHFLSEYYKRENLLNKNLVGQINDCHVLKEIPCFNKSKTKGLNFLYVIFIRKIY